MTTLLTSRWALFEVKFWSALRVKTGSQVEDSFVDVNIIIISKFAVKFSYVVV